MTEPQPWGIQLETRRKKVVVSSVEPSSTADRAGLSVGMVLMTVAGIRVYDSATASRLGASAGVPTQLGFDAPASGNILTHNPDDPQQRQTGPELEPEQLPLPSKAESPGHAGGCVRDTEEFQVHTDLGDSDGNDMMMSVTRHMELLEPDSVAVVSEDEDEELLPGDHTDNARP